MAKFGWGTAIGWIFGQLSSKEERRRNSYAKLKKLRKALLKKPCTKNNRYKLASIDKRLRTLEAKAINQ